MNCSVRDLPKGTGVHVNGVRVPHDLIAREAQNHPARNPTVAWQDAARSLVVRELLLQEARRLNVKAEPLGDDEGRHETEEEAQVRALVEREVKTPEPDEAAFRRYYEQNRKSFEAPAIYQAAHILFAARGGDEEGFARAMQAANGVLEILKSDPSRFEDLAKAHSACPSAAQGGNLGQITRGQTTKEFEDALFAMPVGTISFAPVETRYGLHIIRLDRKIEGRQLPFELVAERIADYLRDSVTRRAIAQYIARLVSRAEITGIALDGAQEHRVN